MRAPTSLPHGHSIDPIQKEVWRLDGSQDKKERRRNGPETEGSRRWREEERETGLLGRRDRRKEGDRENEYRKSDRRADIASNKETTETRSLPSSDRWNDVTSRTSGNETRRDSKWSSRWGPEDKEKDSRTEKRIDVEKEDAQNEKQSSVTNNRAAPENGTDSRDKWRPRHRQEVHSGGSTVYRAAPGFGLERGRVEGTSVGFAPGRGRSNLAGSRLSSAGPIGAVPGSKSEPGHGKSGPSADAFCYPRGKLLDIYRKHKLLPSFDTVPDWLEEVSPITQSSSIEPLAFVAPDAEEEAVVDDIWKGKISSSEASHNNTIRDKMGRANNNEKGLGDLTLSESKHGVLPTTNTKETGSSVGEHENKVTAPTDGTDSSVRALLVSKSNDFGSNVVTGHKVDENSMVNGDAHMENSTPLNHPKFEDVKTAASFDIGTKLPDDSNSLFDMHSLLEILDNEQNLKTNVQVKQLEHGVQPEELSLFYRDPQGEIQGPFWGVDIISWFGQGFFGTDLPVCLSDAPEGTPFQELGEVMPHLKLTAQSLSGINSGNEAEISNTIECNIEASTLAPDFTGSAVINEQQWPLHEFEGLSDHVQPIRSEHEDHTEPHYGRLLPSGLDNSANILNDGRRSFHELVANDAEEVFFPGRPRSSGGNPLGKQAGNIHDPLRNSTRHFLENEIRETIMLDHGGLKGNNLHPFGLSWSELEGTNIKHSQSSNTSGVGDQGHLVHAMGGRDTPLFSLNRNSFSALPDPPVVGETWPDNYRRNTLASSSELHDAMDARHLSHLEQESIRLDLAEHVLSQQLHKQQLQQQNLLSSHPSMHLNGSVVEQLPSASSVQRFNPVHQQSIGQAVPDLEQLLKLQIQQQRQFQLQQQYQLQQQLHHHQLQLQQQQQQQSQVEQLLLDQFIHHNDPGFGPLRVDRQMSSMLDEALFRQQHLHELQQHPHPARHHEQLIQAKFGQSLHPEHHNHLLELLAHERHGRMLPVEQQLLIDIQREQLQAQQFTAALRQQQGMEEERRAGGVWSVDESGRFVMAAANPHQTHSPGFSHLDYHQQQRPSSGEQTRNLERNLALHELLQRGLYEPSSLPFERSISFPAVSSGVNMDLANALARVQGRELQEQAQMHSAGQMGPFSSRVHPHHPQIPNQIHASQLDVLESQIQQLHLEAERKKRDSEVNLVYEDLSSWASTIGNDEISKRAVTEFLHKKMSLPSSQSLELGEGATSPHERRDPSWAVSASASDHPYNIFTAQVGLGDSFSERPHGVNLVHALPEHLVNAGMEEKDSSIGTTESSQFICNSGAFVEDKRFFIGMNEMGQAIYSDSNSTDKPSVDRMDSLEVESMKGKNWGSKSKAGKVPVKEAQESAVEKAGAAVADHGELLGYTPSRHASLGNAGGNVGFYKCDMGVDNAYGDDMGKNRVSAAFPKGPDNSSMNYSNVRVSSSQEALYELASSSTVIGKNPVNFAASNDGRRDLGGNPTTRASETEASTRKDMRFCRTLSCSETDIAEPLFIDMLRKPVPEVDAAAITGTSDSSDVTQASRNSSKKKGKKGRQIDPALLGFKISSNRIMMGEIQRLEE
ncbi:protein ESSENTIAL FOR POTEXVIRUS ACCUMULATION 1-like isoform X3 [Magnolia sinica]|nr:protein ESSENTIAL FOR POTEXVIRUS ACCUMULATION 1-like isoform X3 [Magnolia sinica]